MCRFRSLSIALAGAALVLSAAAGAQEKQWSKVRIATEGAFKPWNFHEPGGKLVGFEKPTRTCAGA